MLKEIELNGRKIQYTLTRKRVRNINLRIKPDCTLWVSVNRWVLQSEIERFIFSKEKLIVKALEIFEAKSKKEQTKYFDQREVRESF